MTLQILDRMNICVYQYININTYDSDKCFFFFKINKIYS